MIIHFDDKITTLNMIINELKKGNFTVKGKAIYLKKCSCAIADQGKQCVINGTMLMAVKTGSECIQKGGAWIKIEKAKLPVVSPDQSKVKLTNDPLDNTKAMPNYNFGNDTSYQ